MTNDPYRTLGLEPGASLDDVKRAYRRLAKRYHPDAAGEQATERFLAIHVAYEAIVGPTRPGGRRSASRPTTRPWEADPNRARATRDSYRTRSTRPGPRPEYGTTGDPAADGRRGQARDGAGAGAWWKRGAPGDPTGTGSTSAGPTGAGASQRPGTRRAPGARGGTGAGAGDPAAGGSAAGGSGRSTHRTSRGPRAGRRSGTRRKATLNSTSYDEAAHEPFEPGWEGGSWYGPSSGTYWTINPKEYADPRKHGPEYQARARRAAGTEPRTPGAPADAAPDGQPASVTDDGRDGGPGRGSASRSTASDPWAGGWTTGSTTDSPPPASQTAPGQGPPRSTTWAEPGDRPPDRPAAAPAPRPAPVPPIAVRSNGHGSALTAGLLVGGIAAIPGVIAFMGSSPNGDSTLAAVGVLLPLAAGTLTSLAVLLFGRTRAS